MPSVPVKRRSSSRKMLIDKMLKSSDPCLSGSKVQSFSPERLCSDESATSSEFEYMLPYHSARTQKIKLRQLVKASEALTFEITVLEASKERWLKQFRQFEDRAYSSLKNFEKWSRDYEKRLRSNDGSQDDFAANQMAGSTVLSKIKCTATVDTPCSISASSIQEGMVSTSIRKPVWHLPLSDLISVFGRSKMENEGKQHSHSASASHLEGSSCQQNDCVVTYESMSSEIMKCCPSSVESDMADKKMKYITKDTFISNDGNTHGGSISYLSAESINYLSDEYEIGSDDHEIGRMFMLEEESDFIQENHEATFQQTPNYKDESNDMSTVNTGTGKYVYAIESNKGNMKEGEMGVLDSMQYNFEDTLGECSSVFEMEQRSLMKNEERKSDMLTDDKMNFEEDEIDSLELEGMKLAVEIEANNCVDAPQNDPSDVLNPRKQKDALEFEYNICEINLDEAQKNVNLLEQERQNLMLHLKEYRKTCENTLQNYVLLERKKLQLESNLDEFDNKLETILQRNHDSENERCCMEDAFEALMVDFQKIEQHASILETQNGVLQKLFWKHRQKLEKTQHRITMLEGEGETLECDVDETQQHVRDPESFLEISSCKSKQENIQLCDLTRLKVFEGRPDLPKQQLHNITEKKQHNEAIQGSVSESSDEENNLESAAEKAQSDDANGTRSFLLFIEDDFKNTNALNASVTEEIKKTKTNTEAVRCQVPSLTNENENLNSSVEACTQSLTELESDHSEIQFKLQNTEAQLQKTIGQVDLMKSKYQNDFTASELGSVDQMQIRSKETEKIVTDLELEMKNELEEQYKELFLKLKNLELQFLHIGEEFLSVKTDLSNKSTGLLKEHCKKVAIIKARDNAIKELEKELKVAKIEHADLMKMFETEKLEKKEFIEKLAQISYVKALKASVELAKLKLIEILELVELGGDYITENFLLETMNNYVQNIKVELKTNEIISSGTENEKNETVSYHDQNKTEQIEGQRDHIGYPENVLIKQKEGNTLLVKIEARENQIILCEEQNKLEQEDSEIVHDGELRTGKILCKDFDVEQEQRIELERQVKNLEAEKELIEMALRKEKVAMENLTKELCEYQVQCKSLKDALDCRKLEQVSMQMFLGEVEEACQEAMMLELEHEKNSFEIMEVHKGTKINKQENNEDVESTKVERVQMSVENIDDVIDILDKETQSLSNYIRGRQVTTITNTACLETEEKYLPIPLGEARCVEQRTYGMPCQDSALNVASKFDAHLNTVSEMAGLLVKLKALREAIHEKAVVKEKKALVPVPVAAAYTGAMAALGFLAFQNLKMHGII